MAFLCVLVSTTKGGRPRHAPLRERHGLGRPHGRAAESRNKSVPVNTVIEHLLCVDPVAP